MLSGFLSALFWLAMSLASDPAAAARVTTSLKELYKLVSKTEDARRGAEDTAREVGQLHAKIASEERVTAATRGRLRQLYETAARDAEREEDCLRRALDKIYAVRQVRAELRIAAKSNGNKETIRRGALMKMLASSAETIPLWVGRRGEEAPQLCGAVPAESNYASAPGDMAAALVRGPDGDENWILAEVVSYSNSSGRYEVREQGTRVCAVCQKWCAGALSRFIHKSMLLHEEKSLLLLQVLT